MASTSAPRPVAGVSRIKSTAAALFSDNQSLYAEIRKFFTTMKEVGVDLEMDNQSQMVKELEAGVLQLLEAYEDCACFSSALQSVGDVYQPGEQLTDFSKLLEYEMAKAKASSSSTSQNHPLLRQFKEAIWHVNNAGLPMPGEEQEDIVMTSTQCNLLNRTCPLSGKPVTELSDPVRSMECKHIYDKMVIMQYIRSNNGNVKCPVSACPNVLLAERVVCDPLLHIEIEEQRSMSKETARPNIIEDFTADGEESD